MERTDEEKHFDEIVASCVWKEKHEENVTEDIGNGQVRLYGVTTLAASDRFGGTRTPAVCTSFERAQRIVLKNEGDIWERSYMIAAIEAFVADGLYSNLVGEIYFYKWDRDEHRYRPIEVPEEYERSIGFGIG